MSPRGLGFASLAVLRAIADGHRYGFDIIDRTDLPSGTVYPGLASLERRDLVTSKWEGAEPAESEGRPRRRYYRVTPAGEAELEAAAERIRALYLPASDAPRTAEG